ncbi:MAG: LysM peptidoglycan-binding domain-containing protein [Clostridiales bacterium]|nr:LysM peptidoglycan-binding domain-containing protein [Clostridiales bacterium]
MAEGESLWEIAKTYLTTQAEIEQANGLEGGPAAPGQMLLIPRKR